MPILTFKPNKVTKQLISCLKDRTADIVIQRFGLAGNESKTLEAIGDKYGITRERIRQIINFSFDLIKNNPVYESYGSVFAELTSHLGDKGKIVAEHDILEHLAGKDEEKNHIYFLLSLGDDFTKMKEDEEFHHRWTIDETEAEKVHNLLRVLHGEFDEEKLMTENEILGFLRNKGEKTIGVKIDENTLRSWLSLSKVVGSNALGEWGHRMSANIKPRGVRDLAFLVLRKEGTPMHFQEVSGKIKSYFSREAHPATVHNELIKDKRFVLVGRGLYALGDWGYNYGTVREVIKSILKDSGPITKEDVIKRVLKERYVKENTILVNLQNRSHFKRNKDGKYIVS
ncbi:MAG: sigma factor-like helix-turn-helix DNA-binding protein [bacterium]|nr:sigma factor-like helix-turn-helix DNA-binding protein [bacterium]